MRASLAIRRIMRHSGRMERRSAMSLDCAPDAETIVGQQLDAYNARDIDAFMAVWHDDAEFFEHPDKLLARGAAEIRARHVVRFKEPDLHGKLIARMSVANLVVDREVVTRNFPDGRGHVDVIAIYEIAGAKIARAWFKLGAPVLDKHA
jgi:hypothetical protein